jgi:hypothetical protein
MRLGVVLEHECPRCHRPVELPIGEICGACRQNIERRASRIARLAALGSTVAFGGYVALRVPDDSMARLVSGVSVALWYILTNLIVRRVLRHHLK